MKISKRSNSQRNNLLHFNSVIISGIISDHSMNFKRYKIRNSFSGKSHSLKIKTKQKHKTNNFPGPGQSFSLLFSKVKLLEKYATVSVSTLSFLLTRQSPMIWFMFLLPYWSCSGKDTNKLLTGKSKWLFSVYNVLGVCLALTIVKLPFSCFQYATFSFLLQPLFCWLFFLCLFFKHFHFCDYCGFYSLPKIFVLVSTTPITLPTILMCTFLVMSPSHICF